MSNLSAQKKIQKKYIKGIVNSKTVTYKIKLTNSIGFMAKSLSSLTINLAERTHLKQIIKEQLKKIISIWKIMSKTNTPLISCTGA